MTEQKFKTNINCVGCVQKVKPFLDQIDGIKWEVAIQDPAKILTIQGTEEKGEQVIAAVKAAGFEIEAEKGFWKKIFG